ncbi:hypothetical protein NPIL_459711 [Nephila pilipes]|uniref:Uncharacterized protein n=1 Tax=Nephila pilipes TaxID=299642 RepID=A0A8X6MH50_NEPPI|nr:hypothetical protein NPIL_459711 [Nephila pilipes]
MEQQKLLYSKWLHRCTKETFTHFKSKQNHIFKLRLLIHYASHIELTNINQNGNFLPRYHPRVAFLLSVSPNTDDSMRARLVIRPTHSVELWVCFPAEKKR